MSIHELPQSPAVRRAYTKLLKVVGEALDGTEDEKKKRGERLYLKQGDSLFPSRGMLVPRPTAPLAPTKRLSPNS